MSLLGQGSGVVLGQDVQPSDTFSLVSISYGGLVLYWVIFGCMAVAAIILWAATFKESRAHRANRLCSAVLLTVATFAYYSMAAQGGYAYVKTSKTTGVARAIYYARYVDWFVTTPLLLLDLLLLAGVSGADTAWILIADVGMILAGLFGALMPNKFKWGWFGIGCVFMLFVFWGLLFHARKACMLRSRKLGGLYSALAIYLMVLWSAYPVCWGLAEGSNTISPNAEAYFYGALDFLAKVVFSLAILFLVEPVLKIVRQDECRTPSLLDAPINGPLTGGSWQPGTRYEKAHEQRLEQHHDEPDHASKPFVNRQPVAMEAANAGDIPHLRTDPIPAGPTH